MERYHEVLICRTEAGKEICVSAPYGKAEAGDLVKTGGGIICQVVKQVEDFTGAVRTVASVFTTVHTCETIWSRYWNRIDEQKKEEAEDDETLF